MQTNVKDYVNAVLPIIQRETLESTTAFALRLTPMGRYSDREIQTFLAPFEYVYVNEVSKKKKDHSHIVLFTHHTEEDLRQLIRDFLKIYFPEASKRGDANKQYNLSEVEDLEMAVTYLLKDNDTYYFSEGINKDVVDSLKKKSYKKYSKIEFATELEKLKARYKEQDSTLEDMMVGVVQLKSLYRQPVNMSQIQQMCLSFHIHNDLNRARGRVQEFLSRYI